MTAVIVVTRALADQIAIAAVAGLLVLGGLGLLVVRMYSRYVKPAKRMAAETTLIGTVNPEHRLDVPAPAALAGLAAAVNQLADRYQRTSADVEGRIAAARSDLEEERNRLAALMSELTFAVIVCNLDGQILLYNSAARELLDPAQHDPAQHDPAQHDPTQHGYVGLGRSVFGIVDRGLVTHALDRFRAGAGSARLATAVRGDRLLGVQVAPVPAGSGEVGGFLLTLDDLTRHAEAGDRRDALLRTLTERTRASLGTIRAAIESMLDYPDMSPQQRQRFAEIVRDEAQHLSDHVDRTLADSAADLTDRRLLEDVLAPDLLAAVEHGVRSATDLAVTVAEPDQRLWLEADSHAVARTVADLAGRLGTELEVRALRLSVVPSGRFAALDVRWQGTPATADTLRAWSSQSLVRSLLDRHGGEAWSGAEGEQAYARILLPQAAAVPAPRTPGPPRLTVASRPEFYDFDLFRGGSDGAPSDDWSGRPLDELALTVFDTETTGLNPSEGDEIVSIGAVRVVNGRLLRQETYEVLVDPGRPISPASRRVHGITEDMLAGQPPIETVLPAFARFADGSVLLGHNVAFDLKFLKLKEAAAGVEFTQPVLDTLLLSPVVHPDHEDHSLEAIAGRLGISVLGRHTSLGDAILTGEIFIRMMALLAAQGITTLGAAQEAARKTYHARVSDTLYKRY